MLKHVCQCVPSACTLCFGWTRTAADDNIRITQTLKAVEEQEKQTNGGNERQALTCEDGKCCQSKKNTFIFQSAKPPVNVPHLISAASIFPPSVAHLYSVMQTNRETTHPGVFSGHKLCQVTFFILVLKEKQINSGVLQRQKHPKQLEPFLLSII